QRTQRRSDSRLGGRGYGGVREAPRAARQTWPLPPAVRQAVPLRAGSLRQPGRGLHPRARSPGRDRARDASHATLATQNGASRRGDAVSFRGTARVLQLHDVLRGGALLALNHFELHALAFSERLEALRLNGAVMHEAVLAAILGRDEAEALGVIEPLHGTGDTCHLCVLLT